MAGALKTLAVLQHTSSEYLGFMEDELEARRIRFRYFRPFTAGGRAPGTHETADGLVLLGGGPWSASRGPRLLPSLDEEIALAEGALKAGTPILGFGLGAQILALAGGGGITPGPLEFEVTAARRVVDEALGGYLPQRFPLVRYGPDRAMLPPGARTLACDESGHPALFQLGERAFGFAGHPGMKSAIIEDLIMEFPDAPAETVAPLAALRANQAELIDALGTLMRGLVLCLGLMDGANP